MQVVSSVAFERVSALAQDAFFATPLCSFVCTQQLEKMLSRLQTLNTNFPSNYTYMYETLQQKGHTFSPNVREKIASKFIYLAGTDDFVKVMCTLGNY